MRKFLIAAHGTFSSGIKSSVDIIIGSMDNVFVIDAYAHGNKSIEDEVGEVMKTVQADDELSVFSDIMGGSVTNQILRFAKGENVHVVSGMSLPLLIDIMLNDDAVPIASVIENAIANAREQLVYVNKLIPKENDHD